MKRVKISDQYYRSGYGKSKPRKANVYAIDGFAYAKDKATAETDFTPLKGELSGYVRVNSSGGNKPFFFQVSDNCQGNKHIPIQTN